MIIFTSILFYWTELSRLIAYIVREWKLSIILNKLKMYKNVIEGMSMQNSGGY